MTNPACSTCRFFQGPIMADEPGFETFGFCRRNPPASTVQVVGDGENEEDGRFKLIDRMASWQFPFLNGATEWCGEHASASRLPIVLDDGDAQDSRTQDKFMLRMPDGMRGLLKSAAKTNNRTMNAEIISRLKVS